MSWPRLLIFALCLFEAGWMAFDGTRALVVGDYVTPSSGPGQGQLGPWRHLVIRAGLDPRGTPMKLIFAGYGLIWLGVGIAFLRASPWAWRAMLVAAVGSLWYLPLGTLLSVVQIGLLLRFRSALGG